MPATTERRTAISLTPSSRPRLCLQPDRSARMLLDGGWWPRLADPAAELPGADPGPGRAACTRQSRHPDHGRVGSQPARPAAGRRAAGSCGSAGSRPCPPACSSRPAPAASEPTCSPSPRMAATRPPGRPWTRPPGRQPQSRSRPPGRRRHQAGQDGPRRNRDGVCEHRAGHLGWEGGQLHDHEAAPARSRPTAPARPSRALAPAAGTRCS